MSTGYRVKKVRFHSGERFPLLISAATGIPLWNPTLFVVTEFRAAGRASATLQQTTRALMFAHQIFDHLNIDLDARLMEGRLLNLGEVDTLADLAGMSQEWLDVHLSADKSRARRPTAVSLEKARMRLSYSDTGRPVTAQTKDIRLMYTRDYLAWLARRSMLRASASSPIHHALDNTARLMKGQLSARLSSSRNVNDVDARQGISAEMEARVLAVTHPDSPDNPWKNVHVRIRNQLIFVWLLQLGLRAGELLGVRLEDINLRTGEVMIARRADDPDDSRTDEPNTKGKSRLLALGDGLAELTRAYVHGPRRTIKAARKTPFLLVATGTGEPLSKTALSKLFVELRRKVPDLPEALSPHVLRHTWNDRFSEFMDKAGVSADDEKKMRRQQMGWSDGSEMAATYTRRHTRRKTNEVSLRMQAAAFGDNKCNK